MRLNFHTDFESNISIVTLQVGTFEVVRIIFLSK